MKYTAEMLKGTSHSKIDQAVPQWPGSPNTLSGSQTASSRRIGTGTIISRPGLSSGSSTVADTQTTLTKYAWSSHSNSPFVQL